MLNYTFTEKALYAIALPRQQGTPVKSPSNDIEEYHEMVAIKLSVQMAIGAYM